MPVCVTYLNYIVCVCCIASVHSWFFVVVFSCYSAFLSVFPSISFPLVSLPLFSVFPSVSFFPSVCTLFPSLVSLYTFFRLILRFNILFLSVSCYSVAAFAVLRFSCSFNFLFSFSLSSLHCRLCTAMSLLSFLSFRFLQVILHLITFSFLFSCLSSLGCRYPAYCEAEELLNTWTTWTRKRNIRSGDLQSLKQEQGKRTPTKGEVGWREEGRVTT